MLTPHSCWTVLGKRNAPARRSIPRTGETLHALTRFSLPHTVHRYGCSVAPCTFFIALCTRTPWPYTLSWKVCEHEHLIFFVIIVGFYKAAQGRLL